MKRADTYLCFACDSTDCPHALTGNFPQPSGSRLTAPHTLVAIAMTLAIGGAAVVSMVQGVATLVP